MTGARCFQMTLCLILAFALALPALASKERTKEEKAFIKKFTSVHVPEGKEFFPEMVYRDPGNKTRKLRVGKKEYVLVNVWATYCPPCLIELPSLNKLNGIMAANKWGRVLPISVDTEFDHYKLEDFMEKRSLPLLANNIDHTNVILRQTPVRGLPTSFLLGEGREILYIFEGPANWASPEAIAFFNSLP